MELVDKILETSKLPKECNYKIEEYSPLAYTKFENKEFSDEMAEDFFPKEGNWYSNCFSKSKVVEEVNLPCHLRDNDWLANLMIKKYNLNPLEKNKILYYMNTSSHFNDLRHEYEQKIVSWQIDWMNNDDENWIIDNELGGELYLFSSKCDYAFRKGIVDTLLAINMNIDAIEEGIEKNAYKWRENHMRLAFYNLYSVSKYGANYNQDNDLEKPSQEHYEKWLKLRLYEYYIEHKDSVDKYGKILPEMKITEEEAFELKAWLDEEHKKRMKQIAEYKNKENLFDIPEMKEIDFYGCDFPDVRDLKKLLFAEVNQNKPKSLIKRIFKR